MYVTPYASSTLGPSGAALWPAPVETSGIREVNTAYIDAYFTTSQFTASVSFPIGRCRVIYA